MDNVIIDIQRDALLGLRSGPRRRQSYVVFIAYRMADKDSREMRTNLERSIREIDGEILVLDGEVDPQGIPWANEVRRRIDRSRLLVMDITGPSREVMFELGFAGNKPFIPVVYRPSDRDSLPTWLTAFQISSFYETGLPRLAAEVVTMLRTMLPKSNAYRRPPPVPGLVIWLESRGSTRFGDAYQRVANLAQRYSLKVEQVDPKDLPSFDDLRQLLRAWMVIACIDGGPSDHASHFFLGDIAGRRRAGSGTGAGQSLKRRGVALIPEEQDLSLLVADSVLRVSRDVLTPVAVENILRAVEPMFATYRRWLLSDAEDL
jgi:hypothetical protein